MTVIDLAFFFRAEYLRRGERKSHTEFFLGESTLPIRQTERGDVDVAFRFQAGHAGIRRTEVLLFEKKLWWPMSFNGMPEEATLAQLQAKLLDRDFDLLGIGPRQPFERASLPFSDHSINRVLSDETDNVLTRALKKMSENLMICDDLAYAVGGEPVYIPESLSSASTSWSALAPCFVNPGKDRSVDPGSDGLRWQPGDFTAKAVQACFRNRAFVPVREKYELPCDTGNLLSTLEIPTEVPKNIDPLEVQVDACFRELWSLIDSSAWAFTAFCLSRDPRREALRRELEWLALEVNNKATTVRADSNRFETTLERGAAVEAFVALVDRNGSNFRRPDLVRECRQTIENLCRSECLARAEASRTLTSEEEQAVASSLN
jgi:hypothetical protein